MSIGLNREVKAGLIKDVKEIQYGNNKRFLSFTIMTQRDYLEAGKYRLNFRRCRCYNEPLIKYILEHLPSQGETFKVGFYFEGESYSASYEKNGKKVYEEYFKANTGKWVGLVKPYSKEENDIDIEIEW